MILSGHSGQTRTSALSQRDRTTGCDTGRKDIMNARTPETEALLTPAEVATMFRVDPKTVTRWATAGRIGSIRTPGGHRRFRESEVKTLLAELTTEATEPVRNA